MKEPVLKMIEEGLARLPFPSSDIVPNIVAGFERFLTESDAYRREWTFDMGGGDDCGEKSDPDDGYIRRWGQILDGGYTGHAGTYKDDRKHIFHYRPRLERLLRDRKVDYKRHRAWLHALAELYVRSVATAREAVRTLDERFEGLSLLERFALTEKLHVLRLLSYDRSTQPGDLIGKIHADRTGLTLHIADQRPGLVREVPGGVEVLPTRPDEAILFPSAKLEKLTGGRVTALRHGASEQAQEGDGNRWIIVGFFHLKMQLLTPAQPT